MPRSDYPPEHLIQPVPAKRILLCFPLRLGPWPEIVRGIYRYADRRIDWVLSLHNEEDASVALASAPDGVIAMVRTVDMAAKLAAWGGPVVDTACDLDNLPFARVRLDPIAIGRMAAEHLLTLKGRRYAYVGDPSTVAGRGSRDGFIGELRKAGHDCEIAPEAVFAGPYREVPSGDKEGVAWIASLQPSAAVYAAHDALAHRVAEACQRAGRRVPEDVAILGTLNDEFLCNAVQPPLSSVSCPLARVGFEASQVLEEMMTDKRPPPRPIELLPTGVVVRQSTDPNAVHDPAVRLSLCFIRDHLAKRIGVNQIVAASGLSRSSLERRFRIARGRSPLDELLTQRVERARHLLAETDLAVKEVARAAGFHDSRHLSTTFREKTGASPTEFRARNRPS